uniref:Uncharacterized protein n=1 Tax=Corethron hystrix TaxID=216773 RepID=A0A7S1BZ53_9STRA|mmetsp:Transcript_6140/g.13256  ORF Transcript_6140/g.13256 Transcript_6140/m.13256 type:complete len:477 (+) Transcript_6140:214-1644(+)
MEAILGNTAYSTTNLNFGGNSRSVTTYNSMQSSAHSPGVVASGANASDGNQDRNKSLTPEETEANIRSYCTSHQNELSCENKFGTNKSLTPGPFMVLQGLCGDGVQNTIDNAPAFPNDVMIRMMEASMADIAVPGSTVKDGSLDHVDIYDTISKCGYVAPSKKDVQSIADSISTWDTQSHRREQTYDIENLADKTEASSLFLQSFPYERDGKLCVYDSLPPMAVAASPQNSPEKKRYKRNGDVSDYPSYTFPTISEGETGAIKLTKVHCADTLSISLSQTSLDELNNSIFKNSESRSAPETFGENSSSRAFSHAEPNLVGTLRPGMIVTGVEIITLDPTNWCKSGIRPFVPAIFNDIKGKKAQTLRYLRIVSPYEGYILLSRGNWLFLTSGMPDVLCGGGNDGWAWRVVCRDGAFVRSGLDLLSDHKCTIPHGSLVRVTRRTINAYGLSRLMVEARKCDSVDSDVLIRLPIVVSFR